MLRILLRIVLDILVLIAVAVLETVLFVIVSAAEAVLVFPRLIINLLVPNPRFSRQDWVANWIVAVFFIGVLAILYWDGEVMVALGGAAIILSELAFGLLLVRWHERVNQ